MKGAILAAVAVCVLAIHANAVWALRAAAMSSVSGGGQFVCTETFKAGLTSFFVTRDTKPAFAEDQAELCEMCAKVARLAFLYSNDAATGKEWDRALDSNACSYVSTARKADCKALTKGVIDSQRSFFNGNKSKFTRKELKGTTEQLGMLVDKRSYMTCKRIGCCPVVPAKSGAAAAASKEVLKPCSVPGDKADVARDRDQLTKDRFLLDKLREELLEQRRKNNGFASKLDLHDVDLKSREEKLKHAQKVLGDDKRKLHDARQALKTREERVKRREDDERDRSAHNKKQEKWLKEKEGLVKDREDVCWKREEQLGIPHPPKGRPPPPPPAPTPPPSRPSF